MKNVLVVDGDIAHQQLMSDNLKKLGHTVVLARTYKEGLQRGLDGSFDIAVLDISLPQSNVFQYVTCNDPRDLGINLGVALKEACPKMGIIFRSVHAEYTRDIQKKVMQADRNGKFLVNRIAYVYKRDTDEFDTALAALQRNENYISPQLFAMREFKGKSYQFLSLLDPEKQQAVKAIWQSFQKNKLTRIENAILKDMSHLKPQKKIADELSISINTVETHVKHIRRKLLRVYGNNEDALPEFYRLYRLENED